ncbi:MAG: hypothetical protein NTX22_05360 [Ignavibacteriales bacterium]|nr:hypothetical protein [Ignavibacteriales bacterium]
MIKTYFRLPYLLKFIAVNAHGYYLKKKRYSPKFFEILDEYLKIDKTENISLDINKIIDITKESNFYSIKNKSDFFATPFINKEIVKENFDKLVNKKHISTFLSTGGTTGSALKYPVSRNFIFNQWAVYWKFRMIHGLDMDTWCAYIVAKPILNRDQSKPPYWIKEYFSKRLYLTLVHLNEDTVNIYLDQIRKNQIKWIHGYPSILASLSHLIKDHDLVDKAKSLNIKCITTSSEMLLGYQKNIVEEVFNCKVRQLYGLTEGVVNIFECEYGSLHIDETYSFVEFIKDDEVLTQYKLIGTQYHNKALPLIRYDTGDRVILENNHSMCKCGRKSRVVKEIIGRETEYLLKEDGRKIIRIGMLFSNSFNIYKAQIVQHTPGHAEFYIIKTKNYSNKDEKELKEKIIELLGDDFRFEIIYTDKLRTTLNGKVKLIINETDFDKGERTLLYNYVN